MVVFSNFSNFTDVSNYYQNAAGPKALGLRLACYTTVGNRFQALCLSPCLFNIYLAAPGLSCGRRDL